MNKLLLKRDKFRDPVHGYIHLNEYEVAIINTYAFQRLRNIKQLAMTYLVFHGAEHTRFGHSVGVMHIVTKAFNSALDNGEYTLNPERKEWLEQILRFIALTHDLGHAPFSHAAENAFHGGLEHEDYTRKIILETEIGDVISEAGKYYVEKYGPEYSITPQLICDIYSRKDAGKNGEFAFLNSFMDSELDCDKMDYLLRDSLYCGVNYGKYDINRLIACLTVYVDDSTPRLAIKKGGVQAFEEFVLARYFMFVEVYFHRTRRYFDMQYSAALSRILPNGEFPTDTNEYLEWTDGKIIQLFKEHREIEECSNIIYRRIYPSVLETKTHPESSDRQLFNLMKNELYSKMGKEYFLEDLSAGKMPHKIPSKVEINDEKAIVIIDKEREKVSTISDESSIIKNLTDMIDIRRLYVRPEKYDEAIAKVQELNRNAAK